MVSGKHQGEPDGYEVEDIGTHSIRQGATTYASSGSTTSPSSVLLSIIVEGGHLGMIEMSTCCMRKQEITMWA